MQICVYGGSSNAIHSDYINAGEALGLEMAKRGHSLIYGGGAEGLMGAVARGIVRGNGSSIGIIPSFFNNGEHALFEHCTEIIYTTTMRERKQIMEDHSDAFIMTPGGIGTFEEFFEIYTLRHLNRHQKPIAILNTRGYYDNLYAMLLKTISEGFLEKEDLSMIQMFSDEKLLLDYLESHLTK